MSDEPFSQDAEQRERRPILGIILILLLLFLLLGGFFLIRNSLSNPLTPTEEATSTATNTPTNTPAGESTEELTSQPTEPATEPPPTEPATEPPPTEEQVCKATGRYCSCRGVSYSVVTCPDGSRTDTPIGSCTPDPGLCGNDNNDNVPPTEPPNCVTYGYCTCQSVVLEITFCNGEKTSEVLTTQQCTPDAGQCNQGPKCVPAGCDCVYPYAGGYNLVCKDSCGNVISVSKNDPSCG